MLWCCHVSLGIKAYLFGNIFYGWFAPFTMHPGEEVLIYLVLQQTYRTDSTAIDCLATQNRLVLLYITAALVALTKNR